MVLSNHRFLPILAALLAALMFGLNAPFSKLLLAELPPMFMVACLYTGAGAGMLLIRLCSRERKAEASLGKDDLVWILLMILLDVLAPFLLLWGLKRTAASNASLLMNFEMVATSLIALIFFKEAIGRRMWLAMGVITFAGIILSTDISSLSSFHFSVGSLFILAACSCWGLENNCTRNMSAKSPAQIVIVKGFGSGLTALAISIFTQEIPSFHVRATLLALLLGFAAYGLSIFFYVKAQRDLGAARTSAYYSAAPFIGVLLSMLILHEMPNLSFVFAAILMLYGTYLAISENHFHKHYHEKFTHEHQHIHDDLHHNHPHDESMAEPHSHIHTHESMIHSHPHAPDIHHRHGHRHC